MKILSVAEIGIFLWLLIGDIKKIKKIVYENKKKQSLKILKLILKFCLQDCGLR